MKFPQSNNQTKPLRPVMPLPPLQINLHEAFTNLQNQCSSFFQNLSQKLSISNHTLPPWARISLDTKTKPEPGLCQSGAAMSTAAIDERLAGVPVYALSNPDEEFVLVSGASTGKSLGLLCFSKDDADALLEQMKSMDPSMRKSGSKVVPLALNKVLQLKVDGVAFRLIPDSSQVKNALQVREKDGFSGADFTGVPVFQSRSMVLRSQNKTYLPAFFRKEDLEKSLFRASQQQKKLNPAFMQGDIQVAVFEEIIKSMQKSSSSEWNVVFIPPGFDVSTDPNHK